MTDNQLISLLSKVEVLLKENHASTQDTLVAGVQLIKTAFSQMAEDNPQADMVTLADTISDTLCKSLKQTLLFHTVVAEA